MTYLVRGAVAVAGRPRVAKSLRLATNEVRLDRQNDIGTNGEVVVQRLARAIPEAVVLDVGCHFGEWAESLLSQPGTSTTLHCFEPSAPSASKARVALAGQAELHEFGLSNRAGEAQLHVVHEGAGSNSLVPFTDAGRAAGVVETVRLSTVDLFCADFGLDRITLLKIDAEGHDMAVLLGAEAMLLSQRIDLIQFEYNWRWVEARVFLLDAFELMLKHGYRLGKVTGKGIETYERWHFELESFREGNYLAYLPGWETKLETLPWWGG